MCIVLRWLQLWLLLVTVHCGCNAAVSMPKTDQHGNNQQPNMQKNTRWSNYWFQHAFCKFVPDWHIWRQSVLLLKWHFTYLAQVVPAATTCAKHAQTYRTHAEINGQTMSLVLFSMFVCWLLSWYVFGILTPQLCIAHCGSGHSYTHCNIISMHMHSLWRNQYVIACSKLLYDLHFAVVCSRASAACVYMPQSCFVTKREN